MRALAKLVRGIVREAILPALDAGTRVLPPHEVEPVRRALFETRWHVYAKAPFAGAQQVFAYLGRYTHRVGILNARLIRYDGDAVTFATKDGKSCTGLVSTSHVRYLTLARAQAALGNTAACARAVETSERASPSTWVELMMALNGHDPLPCPRCGTPLLVLPLPTEAGPSRLDSS